MAEDIYPLGQGRGLIPDIINFGLNNLYQYGQSFGPSNQRMGQVMTDIAAGKENQDLSPLLKEAMNYSPGPFAGTWGPIRTAGAKQAVSALWRHSPEDVMAVRKSPRMLTLTAPKGNVLAKAQQAENTGWMPEGSAAVFDPAANEIRVAPATMVGGHYKAPLDEQLSDLTKSLGLDLPESWTRPRIENWASSRTGRRNNSLARSSRS